MLLFCILCIIRLHVFEQADEDKPNARADFLTKMSKYAAKPWYNKAQMILAAGMQ